MDSGERRRVMRRTTLERPRVELERRKGQSGSALMLTLAAVAVISVVAAAIGSYVLTNYRVMQVEQSAAEDIYAGDGAVKTAVNWARTNPDAALDPAYFGGQAVDDCLYSVADPDGGDPVSVSCEAPTGGESGVPADQGLVPPEALLLTGARHNEPGPYSFPTCNGGFEGFLDTIAGWFKHSAPDYAERSLKIAPANRASGRVSGGGDSGGCDNRTRQLPNDSGDKLVINGKVVAHGKIDAGSATLNATGGVFARYGGGSGTPADSSAAHGGNPEDTDPCREEFQGATRFYAPKNRSADLNIRASCLPVGFNKFGALKPGYTLPVRTTAYEYDPGAWSALPASAPEKDPANKVPKNLVALSSCTDVLPSQPIIFLPGHYKSAEVLNRYTSNSASSTCRGQTIWFAPDSFGPDAGSNPELLNPATRTGAFLMDFVEPVSAQFRQCGVETGELASRWCVGGSLNGQADGQNNASGSLATNPKVVVGWPDGWDPFVDPGQAAQSLTTVTLGPGQVFEGAHKGSASELNYWHADGGTLVSKVAVLDGSYARYEPCNTSFPFFGLQIALVCPVLASPTDSDGRTAHVSGFVGVVGAPAELGRQGDGTYMYPHGKINVNTRWGYKIGDDSRVDGGRLRFFTLGAQNSQEKHCLTVDMPKAGHRYTGSGNPSGLTSAYDYSLSDADAKTLADNCGTEAELKRLQVSFVARGQNAGLITTTDQVPTYYFDGVQISYQAPRGASFPAPTNANGTSTADLTARSDCDARRPGGQLIFNGSSNVYVADGSLQVCGGPYPDDPAQHQVIGIYGVPAVESLNVTSTPTFAGGRAFTDSVTNDLGLPANASEVAPNPGGKARAGLLGGASASALQIGEPSATSQSALPAVGIQVGCGNADNYEGGVDCGYTLGFLDSRVSSTFEAYQPPPGYRIARATLRTSHRDSGYNYDATTAWNSGSDGLWWPAEWSGLPRKKYCAQWENEVFGQAFEDIRTALSTCRGPGRSTGSAYYVGSSEKPILAATQFQNNRQMARSSGALDSPTSLVVFQQGNPGASRLTEAQVKAGVPVSWASRVYCPDNLFYPGCQRRHALGLGGLGVYQDYLEGVELDIEIEPDGSTPGGSSVSAGPAMLRPQSGCITAHPNYEEGRGMPDCALVRADNYNNQAGTAIRQEFCRHIDVGCDLNGLWVGRVSVKGTIYAPSSAFEIDASDVAYPLATRGAILRHLRLSGWETRGSWDGPALSNQIDTTPSARVAEFIACRQSAARRGVEPCSAADGDRILTQARVRFEPPTSGEPSPSNPSYPVVESWVSARRLSR